MNIDLITSLSQLSEDFDNPITFGKSGLKTIKLNIYPLVCSRLIWPTTLTYRYQDNAFVITPSGNGIVNSTHNRRLCGSGSCKN